MFSKCLQLSFALSRSVKLADILKLDGFIVEVLLNFDSEGMIRKERILLDALNYISKGNIFYFSILTSTISCKYQCYFRLLYLDDIFHLVVLENRDYHDHDAFMEC